MSVRLSALALILAATMLVGCGEGDPAASTPAAGTSGAPSAAAVSGSAIEFCQSADGQKVAKSGADVANAIGAGDAERVKQLQGDALAASAGAPAQSACVFTGLTTMSGALRSATVEGVDGPALAEEVDDRLREQGFAVGS